MSAEELKARLERFAQEVWYQGNLAVIDELMAAGFVFHDPVRPIHGPEAFNNMWPGSALPSLIFNLL